MSQSLKSSLLSSVERVANYNNDSYPNIVTLGQHLEFVDVWAVAYNAQRLDVSDLPTTRSVETINKAVINLMSIEKMNRYDDEFYMDSLDAIVNLAISIANSLDESDYADDLADRFNAFQVSCSEI